LVGEQRKAQLAKVVAAIAPYKTQFDIVVENVRKIGFDESSGLQGKLRGSVHDIEEILGKIKSDGLDAGMLMMRRHEKDFLARLDAKYVKTMKEAAEQFGKKLEASSVPAEQKTAITGLLA